MEDLSGAVVLIANSIYSEMPPENKAKLFSTIAGAVYSGAGKILIASNSGRKAKRYEIQVLKQLFSELPEFPGEAFYISLSELYNFLERSQNLFRKYRSVYRFSEDWLQIGTARNLALQFLASKISEKGYIAVLDEGMTIIEERYSLKESVEKILKKSGTHFGYEDCLVKYSAISGVNDGPVRERTEVGNHLTGHEVKELYSSSLDVIDVFFRGIKKTPTQLKILKSLERTYSKGSRHIFVPKNPPWRSDTIKGYIGGRVYVPYTGRGPVKFAYLPLSRDEDIQQGYLVLQIHYRPILSANLARRSSIWKRGPETAKLHAKIAKEAHEISAKCIGDMGEYKPSKDYLQQADCFIDARNSYLKAHGEFLQSLEEIYEAVVDFKGEVPLV